MAVEPGDAQVDSAPAAKHPPRSSRPPGTDPPARIPLVLRV
jgi:hypothetical protein